MLFFLINLATLHPLEDRRTVNALWYTTIHFYGNRWGIKKKNIRPLIILHQDHASSHTALLITMDYLKGEKSN